MGVMALLLAATAAAGCGESPDAHHVDVRRSAVTIDNTKARLDTNGNTINAHDGHIIFIGGLYWLYGTRYPDCLLSQDHCGWGMGPRYANGSSRDLGSRIWGWKRFSAPRKE